MSIKCGFFNSKVNADGTYDRTYPAEDMNEPYRLLVSNGVFATPTGEPSNYLQVYGGNGLILTVRAGRGIFAGKWFISDSDIQLQLDSSEQVLNRIDSVVVKIDNSESVRAASIVIKKGTPATSPVAPAITRSATISEYRLADVYIAAGARVINADGITDRRLSSDCGYVQALLKQIDTSTMYDQWQYSFDTWFGNVKDTLASATLIRRYSSSYFTVKSNETVIPINIPQFNQNLDILNVFVNGMALDFTPGVRYTIAEDNSSITLIAPLEVIGTKVAFEVFKSVDGSDAETVITQVADLERRVNNLEYDSGWINFTLENGALPYSDDLIPGVRKYGNTIHIRGSVKNVYQTGTVVATLPVTMRPAMTRYVTQTVGGRVDIGHFAWKIDATTGQISLLSTNKTISVNNLLPLDTSFIIG